MTIRWVVQFPHEELQEVVRLWPFPGVEVLEPVLEGQDSPYASGPPAPPHLSDGNSGRDARVPGQQALWLRGQELTDELRDVLRGLLHGRRYDVLPDGQLRSPQHEVPRGYLPSGQWIALRTWLTIEMPRRNEPGRLTQPMDWKLVRDDQEPVEPTALLLDWLDWHDYVLTAPSLRLRHLRFACDGADRVVVWGQPLPSLPGTRYVVHEGLAVPCGLRWSPAISTTLLCQILGIASGDLALLHSDSSWEHLQGEHFVPATRQSVRATQEGRPG